MTSYLIFYIDDAGDLRCEDVFDDEGTDRRTLLDRWLADHPYKAYIVTIPGYYAITDRT